MTSGPSPESASPSAAGLEPSAGKPTWARAAENWCLVVPLAAMLFLAQADRDLKGPAKGALGEQVLVERLVERLMELAPTGR